ncbi:MAG: hypothetical protein HLUCCA05_12645 [Roseibaca calidilacus]|jgi:hypothetical protein|uniref:Uncharacterized protein n=1 Tax=Roseibaca calidilacus TaxID=1666912 RepID=A0A0P8AI46_9RHOB|nr:MAG: hypothetical protein HLUCCA05_12645 [Roseibaca calidilacus]
MLSKANYAAVEAGSSALGAIRDTRRRRSRAGRREFQSGVSLLARGRNGRGADGEVAASHPRQSAIAVIRAPLRKPTVVVRNCICTLSPKLHLSLVLQRYPIIYGLRTAQKRLLSRRVVSDFLRLSTRLRKVLETRATKLGNESQSASNCCNKNMSASPEAGALQCHSI